MSDGFDTHELDEWLGTVGTKVAAKTSEKEANKFLRKQARKLATKEKQMYKNMGVGLEPTDTPYSSKIINRFKAGKPYMYGDKLSIRAYNSAPHAHLINNGFLHKPHKQKGKIKKTYKNGKETYVPGYHFIEKAGNGFEGQFATDSEEWMQSFIDTLFK